MSDIPVQRTTVDGLPVVVITPDPATDRGRLALFLPHLGGTKETVAPQLARLAEVGFTAISLDPFRLGERGDGDDRAVAASVFAHFRRDMWPILGQTTLDAVRILDWAVERFPVAGDDIVAGGLSMGGDISVALAGVDARITRVAAVAATPDWTRPGMRHLGNPEEEVAQGDPSVFGRWLYSHLDPATHLGAYAHGPAIAFELGADDTHVPTEAAGRFREGLRAIAPLAVERMRVTEHVGLDHLAVVRDDEVVTAALDWMTTTGP